MFNEIFVQNIFQTFSLKKLYNIGKYSYFFVKCVLSYTFQSNTLNFKKVLLSYIYIYIYIYIYKHRMTRCCSDDITWIFFLCNVVQSFKNKIAQGFYQCNVVWSLLHNISQGFDLNGKGLLSVQYCFKSIDLGQEYCPWDNIVEKKPYVVLPLRLQIILHKLNPVQGCLNTLWTTLHR